MNKLLTMVVCALACWVALAAKQAPNMADYDWYDGTQLTIEGTAFADGETPYCRLPKTAKGKVPDAVFGMSRHATGVNVRFVPKGRKLMFKWVVANPSVVDAFMGPTAMTGLDVYRQDRDGSWKFAANPRYFFYEKDADGNDHGGEYAMDWDPGRPCMVYLPLRSLVRSFKVGIEKGAKIEPMPRHPVSRRIVHYGTSIVHGGCVSRPGMAFAAQEGRLADVEVINHGYSGSGKMEMSMCEVVSSIDAALYVIDCDWNMTVELQKQNYEPFVRELRRLHPSVGFARVAALRACAQGGVFLRRIHQPPLAARRHPALLLSAHAMGVRQYGVGRAIRQHLPLQLTRDVDSRLLLLLSPVGGYQRREVVLRCAV